jgi:N6-adenosine-specific RNA methylase IME4
MPLLSDEELRTLAEDIKANGLKVKIVVHDGQVLDGRNRLRACELAGVEPDFEPWNGAGGSPTQYVLSKNLHRRHLDTSQRALVAAKAKTMFEEEARKRQKGGRGGVLLVEKSTQAKGKARDQAAAVVNVSGFSVTQAEKVLVAGAPELVAAVEHGKIAVSAAADLTAMPKERQKAIAEKVTKGEAKSVREAVRQMKREDLAGRAVVLPTGPKKYRVVYADPPWQYADARTNIAGYDKTAAEAHYPTMSVEELCALEVKKLAEDNAVLFCWATFPLLPDALTVVRAWGFTYKTAIVWAKERANFGNYHDASAELLLVCVRGSCTPDTDKREKQVQVLKREGRHSEKPEHFRQLVDRLYTNGNRIELFRRGKAPQGWDVFGNEAEVADVG